LEVISNKVNMRFFERNRLLGRGGVNDLELDEDGGLRLGRGELESELELDEDGNRRLGAGEIKLELELDKDSNLCPGVGGDQVVLLLCNGDLERLRGDGNGVGL
jgi:hypothetical protein